MINVQGLTKRYGRVEALSDVGFEVGDGESVALWGPNGAGKTTIARCLLGLVRYQGKIEVCGLDVRTQGKAARALIGYVSQEFEFYDDMTVEDTVRFSANLRRLDKDLIEPALEQAGLVRHRAKPVGALSGGMKQRLGLAIALLPDPPVLLLDEPTASLDATARSETLELLEELKGPGRAMLITSHHLEEVGILADRVVAMDEGAVVAECAPLDLAEQLGLKVWLHLILGNVDSALRLLRDRGFEARPNSRGVLVEVSALGKGEAVRVLHGAGINVEDLEVWR